MKPGKKFYIKAAATILIFYFTMLIVLLISEHLHGGSKINSLGMAVWYSIVTLSTVGYGDLVPVSPVGHVIGIIFLLLSMGILATIFGTVMTFVTGQAIPLMLLSFQKNRSWYYFADYGEESGTLARNILKEDPAAVIIFGEKKDSGTELPDFPCMFIDVSPSVIVARKKKKGPVCKVFLMKENDIAYNPRALALYKLPVEVFARTTNGVDSLSGNIRFFHSYDCCARQYWQTKPIRFQEQNIVIIGFGNYGKAILERAILTNVWSETQHITYHIFGDCTEFLEMHYRLDQIFSINKPAPDRDSLIIHKESWASHHELLENADRIIICEDNVQTGWDIYWKLHDFYCLKGRIDLRTNRIAPGISYFGTYDEIYTPQFVMRTQLNRAAVMINDLFRKSVSYLTLSWDELDDFHRQSKIAAADHLLMKLRILLHDETLDQLEPLYFAKAFPKYRETAKSEAELERYRKIEHLRWCRFYYYYNWSCGPVRSEELRQHPMLRPYEELTAEQKAEKDHAWELIKLFTWKYREKRRKEKAAAVAAAQEENSGKKRRILKKHI